MTSNPVGCTTTYRVDYSCIDAASANDAKHVRSKACNSIVQMGAARFGKPRPEDWVFMSARTRLYRTDSRTCCQKHSGAVYHTITFLHTLIYVRVRMFEPHATPDQQ